jgi:hypothetical protein
MTDLPGDESNEAREQQKVIISADKWARNLAGAVARLFFCKYFFSRGDVSGRDGHHFVGRQSNAITARYMAEYLIKSVKKEATTRYKSPTSPNGRSFCVGTVASIYHRAEEMLKADTESAPGTALVLVGLHKREAEANDAWLTEQGTLFTKNKARADNALRKAAYFDGKEYGKTVSLNQQVGVVPNNFKRLS